MEELSIGTTFNLNNDPKDIDIEDDSSYGTDVALAEAEGFLKITEPGGIVIYQNPAFNDTPDYSSPDIDMDVSRIDASVVALPVDDDDLVEPGTYTVDYLARITKSIVSVDQPGKKFGIGGHVSALIISGESIVVTGTNAGTYTIVSSEEITTPSNRTLITVSETIGTATVDGTLAFNATEDFLYNFDFVDPVVVIDMSHNIYTSVLTSTDVTVYGDFITANTRTHNVYYPKGLANPTPSPDPVTSVNALITVSPIANHTWESTIQSVLTYTIIPDSTDFPNHSTLIVKATVYGQDSLDVENNTYVPYIIPAMDSLKDTWLDKLTDNKVESERLRLLLDKVNITYDIWQGYIAQGQYTNATTSYNELVVLLQSEVLLQDRSDDDLPQWIPVSTTVDDLTQKLEATYATATDKTEGGITMTWAGNVMTAVHNLDTLIPTVVIVDDVLGIVTGLSVIPTDVNTITVDFAAPAQAGTIKIVKE